VTPETTALLAFDVNEVLRLAREADARRTPADRSRAADALERARFEAAEFLVDRGNPAGARFAAGWLLRRVA
jgi:hypothetical protein